MRAAPARLRIVSATRLAEQEFWRRSALGQSLLRLPPTLPTAHDFAFENKAGLPAVFNRSIAAAADDEVLLFVHDDVWLADGQWEEKLLAAFARFDIVGVAGNRRRVPGQHTWLCTHTDGVRGYVDTGHISGRVGHGRDLRAVQWSEFGPAPAACELLDGLFIAARADVLRRRGVKFDERFMFHFYDLDFCRSARRQGVAVGTWPIELVHQSKGSDFNAAWNRAFQDYRAKWGD